MSYNYSGNDHSRELSYLHMNFVLSRRCLGFRSTTIVKVRIGFTPTVLYMPPTSNLSNLLSQKLVVSNRLIFR